MLRRRVERLTRSLGIRGVVRGKKVISTNLDTYLPCPDDKADRPNKSWISQFTYVPKWSETVYVVFGIVVFARRIAALRDVHSNLFWVTDGAARHP